MMIERYIRLAISAADNNDVARLRTVALIARRSMNNIQWIAFHNAVNAYLEAIWKDIPYAA